MKYNGNAQRQKDINMANVIILTFDKHDIDAGDCVENIRIIGDDDGVIFFNSISDAKKWQWANNAELEACYKIVEL
jgi:hypothetical protein